MLLVVDDEAVGAMIFGAVGRGAELPAGRAGPEDGPATGGADGPAAAAATLALFVGLGCTTFGLAGRGACAAWSLMLRCLLCLRCDGEERKQRWTDREEG